MVSLREDNSHKVRHNILIANPFLQYNIRVAFFSGYTQPWGIKLQMSTKILKSMCGIKPT